MRTVNSRKRILVITGVVICLLMTAFFCMKTKADNKKYNPTGKLFENSTGFSMGVSDSVNSMSYGSQIGTFSVSGAVAREASKNGVQAYALNGAIAFSYDCSPNVYQTTVKENWNLTSSDEKTVGDVTLKKKVANGTMIILKSSDGKSWENACEPIQNFFTDKKLNYNSIYTTSEEEKNTGTYYRVIVAYEMKKKTGTEKNWIGISGDVYENRFFVEEYDFYICYAANPVIVKDIYSKALVANNSSVTDGFIVDDKGANVSITVTKDDDFVQNVSALQTFTNPGKYTINAVSPLGDSFSNTITVSDGLSTKVIPANCYKNQEKTGYTTENKVTGGTQLTYLMIGQKAGPAVKNATYNGFNAYGITGDRVRFYLKVQSLADYAKNGWEVISDDYGKKETQTIEGACTGTIEKGALIIQKSSDGKNWQCIENGRYANGLYTTNYCEYYSGTGEVLVYTPDGNDVINGIYIRMIFAYEIKQVEGKEKKRCMEEYAFYLCSNDLDAVTFHNLTVKDQVSEICGDDNEIEMKKLYETAETMESGTVTVTGFTIDKTNNPTVTYTVKKNGFVVSDSTQTEFTETGKYDIELKSALGSVKSVSLYVDAMTTDDTLSLYFGDGFIDGKRIYSEGPYPVFEGGHTNYVFNSIAEFYEPLYGQITNLTTNKTTSISASRTGRTMKINEPGEYIVVLNNNPSYDPDSPMQPSGDNKVITFHFQIIPEGTAPGPQINRESLEDSMKKSISGRYPKYYGLMYSSAAGGIITLAFKNYEDAFKYAYNYEKGIVEVQEDGSYYYSGSFKVDQQTRYESNWELTEALNYFAEQAIHELYFDTTDERTYITLEASVLNSTSNPRKLELERGVVIFADGQEALLTDLEALPILNSKPYAYQSPGISDNPESGVSNFTKSGTNDFEFIKDKYGCDSNSVEVKDSEGSIFRLEYNKGVGEQLKEMGCATGKVSITEKTVYGDQTTYDAVYFANGDNTAKLTLSYFDDGQENTIEISQAEADTVIETEAFSVTNVSDDLDPYDLVLVKYENIVTPYVADDLPKEVWTNNGDYEISVINRIGNKYSFTVRVIDSNYAAISFKGTGTESFQQIVANKGDSDISLPVPERYGYTFGGYKDDQGIEYGNKIDQITFNGSKTLTPVWVPKKFNIILKDSNGNEIDTLNVNFGAETEIPDALAPEGYIFDGWLDNGVKIEGNKVTISEEKDMVLVASFAQDENVADTNSLSENKSSTELGASDDLRKIVKELGIMLLLVVLIGGGTVVLIKRICRRERKDK